MLHSLLPRNCGCSSGAEQKKSRLCFVQQRVNRGGVKCKCIVEAAGEGSRGRLPAAHRKMLGALGTFYLFTAQMVAQKVQCSCRLKGSKCCQRAQLLPGWGSYIGATPIVNTPVGCALYAKASHAAPSVHPCVCMWECAWVLIVCLPAMCGSSWRRNQFALPVNCVKKWKGFYLFCSFLK